MRGNRKTMLCAGMLAAAAMMTGCTADVRPAAAPTQQPVQQQTAQPDAAEPDASPDAAMEGEETQGSVALEVDGKTAETGALKEEGTIWLPLVQTGELLGWKAQDKETEEETQIKREITLEKDNSRITVSYQVSDNTIRGISWQKDGLLVPVDTRIKTENDIVYVPAAFFEAATDAVISEKADTVQVSSPEPMDTPQTDQ